MAATEKSAGEPGGTPEVSDGLWNGVRRFFIRLGVHLLAAFAATLAWMMLPEFYPEGGFTVWFSVYMGLICLLPYGKFSDPSWHVPTLAGVIQWLLTWLSGLPGQAALFSVFAVVNNSF